MSALGLLARDVGVDERTLRRAVAAGTLRGSRTSPRKLELALSEREYVRRSWGLISMLRAGLRTERNVHLAVLFGSTAQGIDTPESDIDLLVDLRDDTLARTLDLKAKLAGLMGRPVDLVALADVETEPSLLAQIVRDGRVLVDRNGAWGALRAREGQLRRRGEQVDARRAKSALAAIDSMLST
ncbi:MAG TPA: nucleotidyltransferase domain-containing protein [Solirubrobacteraceae bacterium]|jgi:predicted nucleotidyltransferase|nr:nucleotidyltransferase domain-containing protein [Solirubrobacteraceae bacterium]